MMRDHVALRQVDYVHGPVVLLNDTWLPGDVMVCETTDTFTTRQGENKTIYPKTFGLVISVDKKTGMMAVMWQDDGRKRGHVLGRSLPGPVTNFDYFRIRTLNDLNISRIRWLH